MKTYEIVIRAVIVCDGGEGNPSTNWDGDAIAEALKNEPSHGNRAHWHLESCVELVAKGADAE